MASERLWTAGFVNLLAFDVIYQFGAYMTTTVISVYAVTLGATYAAGRHKAGHKPRPTKAPPPHTGRHAPHGSKKARRVAAAR